MKTRGIIKKRVMNLAFRVATLMEISGLGTKHRKVLTEKKSTLYWHASPNRGDSGTETVPGNS